MNAQRLRYTPFILGAITVLTLASVLIRVRYDLQLTREHAQVRDALAALTDSLKSDLDRAASGLMAADPPGSDPLWHRWTLSADGKNYGMADGRAPQIPQATLQRALEGRDLGARAPLLLGPFATERSGNALAIVLPQRGADGTRHWIGDTALIDALLKPKEADQLIKDGYRLQLLDSTDNSPLYQSDLGGALAAPVTTHIRFAGTDLELAAAPRDGWKPTARWWSSTLLILLAVTLWLSFELRRGRILRDAADDLKEAELRRKQANELYGKAIENISALESRLQVVSMYDTVTGLANRTSLIRRIESALDNMRQVSNGTLAILAIGFDHVHHITNSFGADFASRVLVIAAERVEFVLPSRDLLYRIGDFQLAIVLPGVSPGASAQLANKIVAEIEAPISLDSHTFMLHPSIGIAETSSGYEYPENLLDHANTALGAVQRDVISRYCMFDSSTAKEAVSRLQLEVDLNRAFEEEQFVLEYEPIVLPVSNAVAGFEALIRWNHPTEGRISPGKFVPIAIQAGLSHKLNHWVMREAARQAATWRRAGYRNLFINFNLSAEAFMRPHLDDEIGEVLAEFDIPGNCLVVELTESALIQDLRAAARILQRLSELGLKAWLDDFGTGYSSLSYLRALPLRGVKIDRSFVERTVLDARDFGFLKSLIDLISYLGMQSIAEGIETREQYELLSMTTCDMYQGWHFAHSMPAAQAERWMNEVGSVKLERRA
jgi:diguanylate cyclase (GGDEF)-like protein